jgi:DNA-binding beta-propeller fold protein YncE
MYLADRYNTAIRKISMDGMVTTLVTSGTGLRNGNLSISQFGVVNGVAVANQSLYVTDCGSISIRKISLKEMTVSSISGNGASSYAQGQVYDTHIGFPEGIAVDTDTGVIYFSNTARNVISSIHPNGINTSAMIFSGEGVAGWHDSRDSRKALFNGPKGLSLINYGGKKCILVADTLNNVIRLINLADKAVTTLAGNGKFGSKTGLALSSTFNRPHHAIYDPGTNVFYLSDTGNNRILKISNAKVSGLAGNGTALFADGPALNSSFNQPRGLALYPDGSLLIAETNNHCLRVWNRSLNFVSAINLASSRIFLRPVAVLLSKTGKIYVADKANDTIAIIEEDRSISFLHFDGEERINPSAMSFDLDGNLIIADARNNAIRLVEINDRLKTSVLAPENDSLTGVSIAIIVLLSVILTAMSIWIMCLRKKSAKKTYLRDCDQ